MKAQRGSRGIVLLFFNLGTRWGRVVNTTPRPLYPRCRETVPILQEAVWALGTKWTGTENLAPNGIRSPGPFSPYCVAIPTLLSRNTF